MSEFKYWAFLSYSHQDNLERRHDGSRGHIRWAEWLHDSLEIYRVPEEFRARQIRTGEPMPERFCPVFQDEKELPINADLGESIRTALEQSRFLIVIGSPRSATSRYVNEEVRYFKELGCQRSDHDLDDRWRTVAQAIFRYTYLSISSSESTLPGWRNWQTRQT